MRTKIIERCFVIGTYYTEDLMQKWFMRNLPIAKERLRNFRALNVLLDGFSGYETRRYRDTRNAVMSMCLPEIAGGAEAKGIKRLAKLEKTIELFGVMKWSANKLSSFRSRLASEEYIQSLSAVTELEVASKIVDLIGKENVELYPQLDSGGFSDICVKINGKKVYLEVGNLGESLPESKIQDVVNASAKHLGEKIHTLAYLCLIIDTAELVLDDEDKIDVDASIKELNSEIDMLEIHKLAGFEGFFDLDDMSYMVANLSLYEKMEKLLSSADRRLYDLIGNPKIKSWLNCFDPTLLKKAKLIKGIIAGKGGSTLLVEIHPEKFFPSKASISETESFLNHLARHIETQITEGQLQPSAPNIIAVQGFHWIAFGFDLSSPSELYESIQKLFEKRKEKYLSGVIVFQKEVEKGVYISSTYATKSSQLVKEDIDKLGLRWFKPNE